MYNQHFLHCHQISYIAQPTFCSLFQGKKDTTTKKQRDNKKIIFEDELDIPARSKMSMKRKARVIRDLNDNPMVSIVNKKNNFKVAEMQVKNEVIFVS